MPRRDGLPTNREMVVDFNGLSRTAYIDAYNRITEDGFPTAFEDKPLDAMFLRVTKTVPSNLRVEGGVTGEQLEVETLREEHVGFMTDTLGFQDTPEDVLAHYYNVAHLIGRTTLHSGLDIAAVLPSEGVNAGYTANYSNGRTHHISTFKEKPFKASIAAGKYFAEQAVQDINITDLSKLRDSNTIEQAGGTFRHIFLLRMIPNLPLNGHESKSFLNAYANNMLDETMNRAEKLERIKALGAPEAIVERAQDACEDAQSSYDRVQGLLDKK